MASRLFLMLYTLLWRAARPWLRRHKRLADSFARRLVPEDWAEGGTDGDRPPPHPFDCWIQAASGGEAYLARRLVLALMENAPRHAAPLRLLCTACTRQGMEVLEAVRAECRTRWPDLELIPEFFPLDEPALQRRAVALARPKVVVLLETELWPGLMDVCTEAKIPMLVLNGRMREASLRGYRRLRFFWKRRSPARTLAISEEDARRFAALFGTERVGVMPNMKFDGLECAPLSPVTSSLPLPPELPFLLLASVRRQEEALLLPVLETMLAGARITTPDAALVIAPRHMERVPYWQEALKARGLSVVLRSALDGITTPDPDSVILWDRFGELAALYSLAGAVFVGGSLAALGGQNFLEPLAAGRVPCIGPFWSNFAWAGECLSSGLVRQVADADELAAVLPRQLRLQQGWSQQARQDDRERVREDFSAFVARKQGGSREAASLLATYLIAISL